MGHGDELGRQSWGSRNLDSRVNHANTALETVVKVALSTTTGKDLSLDDHIIITCRGRISVKRVKALTEGVIYTE